MEEYDINAIKYALIHEKMAKEPTLDKIKKIMGNHNFSKLEKYINFNNTFEIEFKNESYYTIHDLGDGDYLAVNNEGKIFGLYHDPFKIDTIFDNPVLFAEACLINRGKNRYRYGSTIACSIELTCCKFHLALVSDFGQPHLCGMNL